MSRSISLKKISTLCGAVTALIGVVGLAGWFVSLNILTSFQQDYVPIAPNTALLFLFLGVSLSLQGYSLHPLGRLIGLLSSLMSILIASLTLIEVLLGVVVGINSLLYHSSLMVGAYPAGNMSPITAACFFLFGCTGLAFLAGHNKPAGIWGMITGVIGGIILIGYAFGTPLLYGGPYIPVALPTAIGIIFLSCGYITLAGTDFWPLRPLSGQSTRARLLRSLLPVMILLMLFSEWIHLMIQETKNLNPALITAFEVIFSSFILVLVISWISRIIGAQIDQTKEALIESEEKYRIIAESTSDVIWHLDLGEMKFTFVSPSVKQMRGYTPEEVLHNPLSASLTPKSFEYANKKIHERISTFLNSDKNVSDSYTDLLDQPCKDGSVIHSEIVSRIIKNSRTGSLGMIGVTRDVTERVLYQTALEASEQRSTAIFNSMFQFIGLLTPDGVVLDINETALAFGGLTKEEVVGRPFWDAKWWTVSETIRDTLIVSIKKAGTGEFIRYEVPIRGKDEKIIIIDFSLKPVFNENGNVSLLIPEGRDITERKKTEERLTMLAALLEVSPAGVIVHDNDGTIVFTNTAELEYHGYSRDEFLTHTLWDLTVLEDKLRIKERMDAINDDKVVSFIVHHYRKDGSIIPIEVFARKTLVGDQDLIVSVNIDITDRIRKNDQIRMERDRAEQYLNIAEVMIMALNREGTIIQINRKGVEILGISHAEILGSDWYRRFIPISDQLKGRHAFARVMAGDIGPYISFENTILSGDGSNKILLMKSVHIYHDGKIVGLLISGEDITEKRLLEKEKEEAIREIQQNLAQLAILNDEIRNPLTIISCIAEMETDEKTFNSLLVHINRIDDLITGLDNRWSESQKVLSFLRKHYQISIEDSSKKS